MSTRLIVPVVEGHGEVQALPVLIRRIFAAYAPEVVLRINPPSRIKAGSFLNDEAYFAKYVSLAAAKAAQDDGSVLILIDCEDDCPAELGPRLLEKATKVRDDVPYLVALAYREYETWFLASAESLGFPSHPDPEAVRGAKEWLSRQMPEPYDPIRHQAEFTARFDLEVARTVASFDRLVAQLTN